MDDDSGREEDDVVVLGVFIQALFGLSIPEMRVHMNYHERRSFVEVTDRLTEFEFRRAFRMHREVIFALVALVREGIETDSNQAYRKGGASKSAVRVTVVVRVLSGSTYIDMMKPFGLSRTAFYDILKSTVPVLISTLPLDRFPDIVERCHSFDMAFVRLEALIFHCTVALVLWMESAFGFRNHVAAIAKVLPNTGV